MGDFGTLLNTCETRLSTFEHIEILSNVFENHFALSPTPWKSNWSAIYGMGNFQDAGNEPDPPFHLLLQLFGANDLFFVHCRSLKKVKFSTDQFRPALGSGCCLIVTMLKKPQNCPISDFFDLTPIYFLSLLHYTDPVPPSSDPVPPSTKQYRPILTQYHHIFFFSNSTLLCRPEMSTVIW